MDLAVAMLSKEGDEHKSTVNRITVHITKDKCKSDQCQPITGLLFLFQVFYVDRSYNVNRQISSKYKH